MPAIVRHRRPARCARLGGDFGIVTKLGLWLQPKPEVITHLHIDVKRDEDLGILDLGRHGIWPAALRD